MLFRVLLKHIRATPVRFQQVPHNVADGLTVAGLYITPAPFQVMRYHLHPGKVPDGSVTQSLANPHIMFTTIVTSDPSTSEAAIVGIHDMAALLQHSQVSLGGNRRSCPPESADPVGILTVSQSVTRLTPART